MKTLDDAVIELGGVLPDVSNGCNGAGKFVVMKMPMSRNDKSVGIFFDDEGDLLFTGSADQFQQRAKELGFINGYRWGVEYKTDGKRPDLPDDVLVISEVVGFGWNDHPELVKYWIWLNCSKFKITDERYKPADTSYLEKPALEPVPEEEDWYDYDNQKALRLPPVGSTAKICNEETLLYGQGESGEVVAHVENTAVVRMSYGLGCFTVRHLQPLDHSRKAKDERKKVARAALHEYLSYEGTQLESFYNLYDKGFLKLPE